MGSGLGYAAVGFVEVWCGMVRWGVVWLGLWSGSVWFGMVLYGIVGFGLLPGKVRCG